MAGVLFHGVLTEGYRLGCMLAVSAEGWKEWIMPQLLMFQLGTDVSLSLLVPWSKPETQPYPNVTGCRRAILLCFWQEENRTESISDTRWAPKSHLRNEVPKALCWDFNFFLYNKQNHFKYVSCQLQFLEDEDTNIIVPAVFSKLVGFFGNHSVHCTHIRKTVVLFRLREYGMGKFAQLTFCLSHLEQNLFFTRVTISLDSSTRT